jgi:hypothetical protein
MRKALQGIRSRASEFGATTAEYAVCTGAGVGFAGVLFQLLTSGPGQTFLSHVWDKVTSLLPF